MSEKKKKLSTFCAFIDFKNARDSVDRTILGRELEDLGLQGKMLHVVYAIYRNVYS